jgi:hypothetical protein
MAKFSQVVVVVQEGYEPLVHAAVKVINEVMSAGAKQRIEAGLPTDQWLTPDVKRYMHHAFMHLVACKTHEGIHGHPFVLADNTSLEEYKHALVDLLIIAADEIRQQPPVGLVVETPEGD